MGKGERQNSRGGGASQILPLQKKGEGAKKFKPCWRGDHNKFWGSFNADHLRFSHTFKGGERRNFTLS